MHVCMTTRYISKIHLFIQITRLIVNKKSNATMEANEDLWGLDVANYV